MECPKCRANNSDDAVSCGLCYHNFKPKAASFSVPASRPSPAMGSAASGDVTVKCYGLFTLTKGQYLFLQTLTFLFILGGLTSAYSMQDAAFQAMISPEMAKEFTAEKLRGYLKIFFWVGLVYESGEAWFILGKFREKEAAARSL